MRITDMITQDEFCLIFYQLLLTTSIGNEQGQQMRIQSLISGFKGLSLYCKAKNITMNSMKMNDSFKKDLEGVQNCLRGFA